MAPVTSPEHEPIRFATLWPGNTAALHFLELVCSQNSSGLMSSSSSLCQLIDDDKDGPAYALTLPFPSDDAEEQSEASAPRDRWRISSGSLLLLAQNDLERSKVDILLCYPGNSRGARHARKFIKSIHAVLVFHPESGAVLLRNIALPIIYKNGGAGGEGPTLLGGASRSDVDSLSSCALLRRSNRLCFGDYDFVLEFNLEPQDFGRFMA